MYLLRMPQLGQTMDVGTVVGWSKELGESFVVGEDLFDVATEKVEVAVEAKSDGVLLRFVVTVGEEVDVGTVLAVVGAPGEAPDEAAIEQLLAQGGVNVPPAHAPTDDHATGTTPGTPQAGSIRSEPRPPPDAAVGGQGAGPIVGRARQRVIPRARIRATELGIDLAAVSGTGSHGAITLADVERFQADATPPAPPPPAELDRHRLTGVRRAMATGVARSWAEIPQFTQSVLVDCSTLVRRRATEAPSWEARYGLRPSVNHYLVQAVVNACQYVPDANARLEGDEIITYLDINPTLAVASPSGLLTPVLRKAQEMDLGQMALGMVDLVDRARRGELTLDDFSDGTITISNLGMFGVDTGTPLVNAHQAVIVFAGVMKERPIVVEGQLCVRPSLYLTIAADHRILDGLTGALFLGGLKDELEHQP